MSLLTKKHKKLVEIYKPSIDNILKINGDYKKLIELAFVAGRQAGLSEASIFNYEMKGFEVPDVAICLQYKYILTALLED